MACNYTVQQGDYVSSIADQFGFSDYKRIWNHPENADLKRKRQNPNVLLPGDQLFIPDKEATSYSKPTGQSHEFQVTTTPLKLRIKLDRFYSSPISSAPCELRMGGNLVKATSDANGIVEVIIPKSVHDAILTVHYKITAKGQSLPADVEVPIKIGHLNPESELSGQVARLSNLGYYRGDPDILDDPEFVSAVEEFQSDHGLTVDGDCGPRTQAKLRDVHGC